MTSRHPVDSGGVQGSADHAETLQELREKIQRYELIFRATQDVLYDLNLQDASVEWNEPLYSQYGYSHTEPTQTLEWWVSHVHPDDAFMLENKVSDLVQGDTDSWQCDYRFRRADGDYNYVRDRGLMLRDRAGKPVRIIGSLLDMTAQKQLDTAKDEFISLVSHQLRTPLTVIRVYGEMLTSGMLGQLTPEQAKWVRNMTNSSARLIDVVGDILNVSRIDLGRVKIATAPHDMTGLTRSCVKDVMPLAAERQVRIRVTCPNDLPLIPLDDTIFMQIVHNLLTNAIRYTQPQLGRVTVSLKATKDGYLLAVRDNGIGIPAEARDHVFERFYRAKNALGMEVQGSGLGLYLVKVMSDAYRGKVWFESSVGKGTTFYVQVPITGMISPDS